MINGKTIVLTGASSGIGLEVLKLLAEGQDNRILAVSRHAVEKLTGFAPNVTPFDCDVSSPEGIEKLFAQAESMFEKIDIFYANAGYSYYEEINYCDWDRVQRIFETNVFSPIYTYQKYRAHLDGRPALPRGQTPAPSVPRFLHGYRRPAGNIPLLCAIPLRR